MSNFIPTLSILKSRKLRNDDECLVCSFGEEIVEYIFRDCGFTKQILQEVGMDTSPSNTRQVWKQWLACFFQMNNTKTCIVMAITIWALWYNRNIIYHEDKKKRV